MVNVREKQIIDKYEAQGWKTIRGGAPDFLFLKVENEDIKDILFVEVKDTKCNPTYEQSIYLRVLRMLGAKAIVETIK